MKGGYSDLNREHIMPHIITLPIELYPPYIYIIVDNLYIIILYSGMIRTFSINYQKIMTYLLVYEVLI